MALRISNRGNVYERIAGKTPRAHRIVLDTSSAGNRRERRHAAMDYIAAVEPRSAPPGPIVLASPTAEALTESLRQKGYQCSCSGATVTIVLR